MCDKEIQILGIDYVICEICSFKAKSLTKHITQVHGITKQQYIDEYPEAKLTSDKFTSLSKERNAKNGDWINRANENGEDLTAYKQKMGMMVSKAIMSNPEERQRRANQMALNNQTPEARERSRQTAIRTSAKLEVQQARAERLAEWRNANFDTFYEKCIKALINHKLTKPELNLYSILKEISGYNFQHQFVIESSSFMNKSQKKCVDFGDSTLHVYIEFDGVVHFLERITGVEGFKYIKKFDRLLDEHITLQNWTLIRISYDQYVNNEFTQECLERLFKVLKDPTPGVHYIGDAYATIASDIEALELVKMLL